jgi:hypothetical protein
LPSPFFGCRLVLSFLLMALRRFWVGSVARLFRHYGILHASIGHSEELGANGQERDWRRNEAGDVGHELSIEIVGSIPAKILFLSVIADSPSIPPLRTGIGPRLGTFVSSRS